MIHHPILLFTAGLIAGALNAAAGGGSFLAFPALIYAGVPPIIATASGTVVLFPGSVLSWFGWQWSMASILCSTIGCLSISVVPLLSRNYAFRKSDLGFLIAGLACVGIYLCFAIIADALPGIPTIRKAYADPASERSVAWILGVISSTLALIICIGHDWIYVLFPAYLFLFNGIMAGLTWGKALMHHPKS